MNPSAPQSTLPSQAVADRIPVLRPWAPPAQALAPYLEQLDQTRWYSNFGPLNHALEQRLGARFGENACVVTAANGTLALTLALRAMAAQSSIEPGALCLMPAWTFSATAHAALLAGFTPYLADVDETTAALTPDLARGALARAPSRVGFAIPVLPYGAPLDLDPWRAFESETGVRVLVDAAAGFDAASDARLPLMVSMHATKALGAGEGAFLALPDKALADEIRSLSVFGFKGAREARMPALNAKLSEYHAAVGLAALDFWPRTRARLLHIAQLTRAAFALTPELVFQPGWGADWASATCIVRTPDGAADRLARALDAQGVETRNWWAPGLHRHPAFRAAPRAGALDVTNRLSSATLGLPFAIDLAREDIMRTAAAMRAALAT